MIPEMNGDLLQWLRSFYYVATTGSIARAAESVHRTPGAISYQLQSLEQSLGNTLFARLGNRLVLTASGRELLKWAIRTFDLLSAMQGELASLDGHARGCLSISGVSPMFRMRMFAHVLRDFLAEYPKVRVELLPGYPDELIHDIEMGKHDFSLVGLLSVPRSCRFTRWFESPQWLAAARDHPFELDERPGPAQLAKVPYIEFIRPRTDRQYVSHFFPAEQVLALMPTRANLKCSNRQTIMEYVAAGCGCAVMDAWSLLSLPHMLPRLRLHSLRGHLPDLQYGVLTRQSSEPTPAGRLLVERLEAVFSGLDTDRLLEEAGNSRADASYAEALPSA